MLHAPSHRLIAGFIAALMSLSLLTSCQPDATLPNAVTSKDQLGEITLRFPDGWTIYPEASPTAGRQGVTLARFTTAQTPNAPVDLTAYPIIRISYDQRSTTILTMGTSLEEYTARRTQALVPGISFEAPQTQQIAGRLTAYSRGMDADGRGYYILIADFAADDAVVEYVLSAPTSSEPYEAVVTQMVATTVVRMVINPDIPTLSAPPTLAIIVPEVTPEATAEVTAEVTAEITAEVTAEVAAETPIPMSTDETAFVPIPASSAVFATATPIPLSTNEVTDEATLDAAARTLTLTGGLTLVYPVGWTPNVTSDTTVTLALGSDAMSALNPNLTYPTGQAFILLQIGKPQALFRLPDNEPVDLQARLQQQIEATASNTPAPSYAPLEVWTLGINPAVAVLATTEFQDQYTLLVELGAGYYASLRLTTASGEGGDFAEIARSIAATMRFPTE
ncbi:MAG: hypothetical protein H7Y11_07595 [Armatimonadetes bacterium]|nr:hypothetical protein [Anaerolineae bacterium]